MVNFKKLLKTVLPDNGRRRARTNSTREPENADSTKKEEKRSSTTIADKQTNIEDTFKSSQSISDPKIEYHFEAQETSDNEEEDDNAELVENDEDDEEGTFAVAFDLDSSANDENKDFACLSPEEIIAQQSKEIQSVADLFSISPTTAGLLLRHFQWKKEKLITKFFENPEQVYKESGVSVDSSTSSKAIELSGEDMCSICGDDMPAESCTALSCAHRFCNDCWKSYLTTKIKEGETKLNCPQHKCNLTVEESTVKKLVDYEVYDRYIRFVTKSFVEDSGNIKWCPQANCGNAITADMISGTIVKCSCGYRFCFSCHREAHAPATCEQVKQWERKCKDDSETEHWKYANTKDCPKCTTSVEKNGGCNHMTCRQCKHEWCWVCIRPWKGHNDYYNCNKFMKTEKPRKSWFFKGGKKDKAKEREEEREKNRIALERYLHYYERHINHSHSSELEKQIRTRAISKMTELQKEATTTSEVQYIIEGTEVLFECRNVLKYTYVTGYYLPEVSSERGLFEYLQEDLEKTTEMLSEVLESSDISKDRFAALNVIQLAKNRKANLLRGVDEGLAVDVK